MEPWSALVDADNALMAMVGPWQYQCAGGEAGRVLYPVYHPPSTQPGTVPGIPPSRYTRRHTVPLPCSYLQTAGLASTKEILGVEYAPALGDGPIPPPPALLAAPH